MRRRWSLPVAVLAAALTVGTLSAVGQMRVVPPQAGISGLPQVSNLAATGTVGQTTLALTADAVVLRNMTTGELTVRTGASATLDLATAGPAPNGRDQAAGFTNAWVHVYWIWDGSTLATTGSPTAPPTGPTLPPGYYAWTYATTFRTGSTENQWFLTWRARGALVMHTRTAVLGGGSATTETSVSVSGLVPPNAPTMILQIRSQQLTSDSSGNANAQYVLRAASGGTNELYFGQFALTGLAGTSTTILPGGATLLMPNVGQQFFYLWTGINQGSGPALTIETLGYRVPNGDS